MQRALRVMFIPGGVILSTYFGGGFASGRETVEFISTSGPWAGLAASAIAAILLGAAYFLCAELARRLGTYDYASFVRALLGRWAVIYEIALLLGLVVVMAVAATAAGTIIEDQFGLPRLVGTSLLGIISVALAISGRKIIELSMTATSALLLVSLVALAASAMISSDGVVDTFSTARNEGSFWQGALLYGFFGIAFIPLVLYATRGIRTRRESASASIFIAIVFALPMVLLHLSFMTMYPSALNEDVPSVAVAERFGGTVLLTLFVLVLFVLVVQTSVGVIQGLIERVDAALVRRNGSELGPRQRAAFAALILGGVVVMASVGLVTLVGVGYSALAIAYVVAFVIPLFTVGIAKLRSLGGTAVDPPLDSRIAA